MKKITLLLFMAIGLSFSWQSSAQLVHDNTCTTALEDISATGTSLTLTDDGEANITIPFAFTLDGVSSSDLRVGNNGGVLFNTTTGDVGVSSTPTAQGFYPFSDDIDSDYGGVFWEVLGTAPNRRVVILWNDRPHYSNSPSGATFELILYETTNEISFVYSDTDFGAGNTNNDGVSAGILVVGANSVYTYSTDTALAGVTCIHWAAPACTQAIVGSSTVVDDCGNSQFSVDVDVTTVGDATHISNGTDTWPISGIGVVTVGPFDFTTSQTLTVVHSNTDCNLSLGTFETGCTDPGEVCENSLIINSLPYTTTDDTSNYGDDYSGSPGATGCGTTSSYLNGDDVVYSYTATSDTSINVSMTPTATWSGIFVYTNCADIGTACVAGAGNSGTTERNFDLDVTNGTTYYFVISTFATPQSTGYTLTITENTCTNATVSYAVVNDCAVSGGFLIDVEITDMGTATNITLSDNQGSATQPVTTTGTYTFGPYTNATGVVITVTDDNDVSCVQSSTSLTQNVCPPANDNFANAQALTCGQNVLGDTTNATLDEDNAPDGFGADMDARNVWYSYTGMGAAETITINMCPSTYDTSFLVYTGTSGNLTLVGGNDDGGESGCPGAATRSYGQFTSDGTSTYYIAVEGWNSGSYGAYDLTLTCESACTPTQTNQDCASALPISVNGVATTVDNTCATVNPTQPSCDTFGTIADVWYTFVAPSAEVSISATLGSATAVHMAVYSGSCGALVGEECSSADPLGSLFFSDLTIGATYYLQLWNNGSEEGTFDVTLTDDTLSIGDIENPNAFTYFPNPVKSTLKLKAQSNIQNVSIYNMLGQEVLRSMPNTLDSEVDMVSLQTGTYFVKVTINDVTETIKVIKQ